MQRLVFLLVLLVVPAMAWSHPVDSATPREVSKNYGTSTYGTDPAWSTGDIVFHRDFPARDSLTAAEKYIIAGADQGGRFMRPWSLEILQLVTVYESQHHVVPTELTDAIVVEAEGLKTLSGPRAQKFLSPITGRYPKLQMTSFSRGDVYMRPLTDSEVQHFATLDTTLGRILQGYDISPRTNQRVRAHLAGKVWYVRFYGERKAIVEGLQYAAGIDD